jgi:hypothetical protein
LNDLGVLRSLSALWSAQAEITLGAENITVETCDPLPPAGGNVQVLNGGRLMAPLACAVEICASETLDERVVDADKYPTNALHCLRMANKAFNSDDEQAWLNLAETWLGMIPGRQRVPEEIFGKAIRNRGTRQQPSKSRH